MRNGNCGLLRIEAQKNTVLTVPMRNGNPGFLSSMFHTTQFLPYLWGMETFYCLFEFCLCAWFLPYLWGMETSYPKIKKGSPLGSYRTYEEWKRVACVDCYWGNQVLTVPMRNGNASFFIWSVGVRTGSYRTYEEWKLAREIVPAEDTLVLTVPMRNGNDAMRSMLRWSCMFLPYLWGMET